MPFLGNFGSTSVSARLLVVLGLNLILFASLLVVGSTSHSLSVLAEGVDCLADAAGIALSLMAIRISLKRPVSRLPTLAAVVNITWLLILNLTIIFWSTVRLLHKSHPVQGVQILIVSAVVAVVMGFGASILVDGDDDENDGVHLNRRAALLDTISDAAAALAVAVTGGIIAATNGFYWLDPIVAVLISLVVSYHSIKLLRRQARL